MATRPSPPGRFSTTTGWPQRLLNRSAIRRVPISIPLPGPSVTMNLTVRCGHVCAADGIAPKTSVARRATADSERCRLSMDPSDVTLMARRNIAEHDEVRDPPDQVRFRQQRRMTLVGHLDDVDVVAPFPHRRD